MASSTDPNHFSIQNLVIEYVIGTILPILNRYRLFRFGLLRTNTCVLIFPHAAVSVVGMIRASINLATRDLFPAACHANEVPYRRVIHSTAH